MLPASFVATKRHFVDHLAGVWHALPAAYRAGFWCGHDTHGEAVRHARRLGLPGRAGFPPAGSHGVGVAVASGDYGAAHQGAPQLRWVFGEHGCGITYPDPGGSYLGSTRRDGVAVIVVPSDYAAAIQRAATPDIPIVVAGSSPKLDPWAPGGPARVSRDLEATCRRTSSKRPVVAVSFHYDAKVNDWTRSAFRYYQPHLSALPARGWQLLGHGHPRGWAKTRWQWERLGVEPVADFEQILERADLYAVDNSSTLYEAAAAGIPVVALNCPRYRRDVDIGLRFWQHVPGIQCDQPAQVGDVLAYALTDPPEAQAARQAAVDVVYPRHDGHAAQRWADAIIALADQLDGPPTRRGPLLFEVTGPHGEPLGTKATAYEAAKLAAKRGGTYRRQEQ